MRVSCSQSLNGKSVLILHIRAKSLGEGVGLTMRNALPGIAHSPEQEQEFSTLLGSRKELGGALLPLCRWDPNHQSQKTARLGSSPVGGDRRGQSPGVGTGTQWATPLATIQKRAWEDDTNWGCRITWAPVVPCTYCESWKEETGIEGQCGHRTGPMATGQLEPMGWPLAHSALEAHLHCDFDRKIKSI